MDITKEISNPLTVEQFVTNDDKEFSSIYYKAIKRLLDIDITANVSYLHRYFKIFHAHYNSWCEVNSEDVDNTIPNMLKDSLYYRLAFVYRNATLLSSAVAFHFRNVYKKSPTNINRLTTKTLVKICSFGGCAASDIVAIVTVLESIALKNGIELDFRITIIETDERWKITYITILRCLEHFHEATWKITFIHANLTEDNEWTPETCKAIEDADIVTLIRFFSKLDLKKEIMKKICDMLQPQALLFILDHPVRELIELSFGVTDSDDFELIHQVLYDFHPLDVAVVKHLKTLYLKHFGDQEYFKIKLFFNVFISVWIKAPPKSAIKWQDSIESIFQNNVEKYNPKQSFLSANAFTRWENLFSIKKGKAGWNAKGIRKIVLEEKEKRNRLLVEFIDQKKTLDVLQNNFSRKNQSLKEEEKESNDIDEEYLGSYLIQKRHYASTKKTIYLSSLLWIQFM